MNTQHSLIEEQARQQIAERLSRAAAPHLPHLPSRQRVARHLRRFADRLEN